MYDLAEERSICLLKCPFLFQLFDGVVLRVQHDADGVAGLHRQSYRGVFQRQHTCQLTQCTLNTGDTRMIMAEVTGGPTSSPGRARCPYYASPTSDDSKARIIIRIIMGLGALSLLCQGQSAMHSINHATYVTAGIGLWVLSLPCQHRTLSPTSSGCGCCPYHASTGH